MNTQVKRAVFILIFCTGHAKAKLFGKGKRKTIFLHLKSKIGKKFFLSFFFLSELK